MCALLENQRTVQETIRYCGRHLCVRLQEVTRYLSAFHNTDTMLWVFRAVAGISGAIAVAMGAYGSHSKFMNDPKNEKNLKVFNVGNKYHFLHAIVLLLLPLVKRPLLVGCLMVSGKLLFCGSLYLYAVTSNPKLSKFAPVGGYLLIAGWLAIAF